MRAKSVLLLAVLGLQASAANLTLPEELPRLSFNNPSLVTDLGVGLWSWPLPMDYNGDGLMDLVVVSTGVPANGIWYFQNTGQVESATRLPLFAAATYLGPATGRPRLDPQVSYVNGQPVVTTPGYVHPDFKTVGFAQGVKFVANPEIKGGPGSVRSQQWRYTDYDGDGAYDLVVGVQFGGDYGRAGSYDASGKWLGGPLRGYVYWLKNTGTNEEPAYSEPKQLVGSDGAPIEVYGLPSPSFADFRGVGKQDLICGEFLDGFTYFENIGTREEPKYARGRRLKLGGEELRMDLCMITPVAVDFDRDGKPDLVVGDEDGRVAFLRNMGAVVDGVPQFTAPSYFRQQAGDLKFGALASPVSFDWDGDGLDDLIAGNSAGHIGFIRNLGGDPPRWAAPVYLSAEGKLIHEQAGENGSIQGPNEAKWGYTNVSVADWDGDGLPDILCNGVWGRVVWYRNVGTRTQPRLAAAQPVEVAWQDRQWPRWNWWQPKGNELVTQWRTTPLAVDWNGDGLTDLVTLDAEGYLVLFERRKEKDQRLSLQPPRRVFWAEGPSVFDSHGKPKHDVSGLLRLNDATMSEPGRSGRRTFCFLDWDGDGIRDLVVNSQPNVSWYRGLGRTAAGEWSFRYEGPMAQPVLAGHSTTPAAVDWNRDGVQDVVIAAEDGFFYLLKNPRPAR